MKKFAVFALLMLCLGSFSYADFTGTNAQSLVGELESIYSGVAEAMSTPMAPTMTIYNSAGSVFTADTRDFLGIKVGIGVGVVLPTSVISMLSGDTQSFIPSSAQNNTNANMFAGMGQVFAMIPMPYDMLYFKLGMPALPILPQFDLGIRLGFLPDVGALVASMAGGSSSGVIAKTGGFHIGAEARAKIVDSGVFQIGLNVSLDFDTGGLELGQSITQPINVPIAGGYTQSFDTKYTTALKFGWMGTSIGGKLIAALNIPLLSIYAGVGINFNIGSVTSEMYSSGSMVVITETEFFRVDGVSTKPYYFTEIRAIAGFQLLIINAAVEYSINTGAIAVTIHPLTLTF